MPNNLWEIIKFDDLAYLLRNAEKRFVVLTVITEETEESIKKMMKVFVKDKSKLYPKVTFLFYKAKKQDFGRMDPIFNKNVSEYPKMFHIWNVKKIMTGVISVDNKEILESSFEDLHDVYLVGKLPEENEENTDNEEEHSSNYDDHTNEEKKTNQNNNQNNSQNNNKQIQQNKVNFAISPTIEQQQYKDPSIEKKKFIEKLKLLQDKQKENKLEFLSELKRRKEEEEEESGEVKREKREKRKNK
jgi:hypothetical protein